MKNLLLFCLLVSAAFISPAQSVNWEWSTNFDGTGTNYPFRLVQDDNGNSYILGAYTNDLMLDTFQISSGGDEHYYLAKVNSAGDALWLRDLFEYNFDEAKDIDVDNQEQVYICGKNMTNVFNSTGILQVVKLDANGDSLLTISSDTTIVSNIEGITVKDNGNIYIAGNFVSELVFDTINIDVGINSHCYFFIGMDSVGSVLFFNNDTISDASMPYGLALLKEYEGDFYIAGTTYISNIDFGNGVELNPVGIAPFFVKFDSTGTAEWGEAGNASWCQAELQDLTVSNGKIAICGMFCEKFALGGDTLDYPMETNMYFASFFENGTLDTLFSVSSGTSGVFTMAYDHATNIATDVQGNVYFNAMFGDTMFFAADTILLDTTDVSSIFLSDDYMVGMFDSTFQPQWAYSLGNIIDFHGWGDLYSDELGNVFFVGVQLDSATKSVTGNSFVAKKGSPNVGLNDVERSGYALLKAYPNPVINSLSLELTDKYDKIISYEVYSIDGKRIFNGVANSTSILLDMTSYIDSYYIVRINTEKGLKYSAKILKNSNR